MLNLAATAWVCGRTEGAMSSVEQPRPRAAALVGALVAAVILLGGFVWLAVSGGSHGTSAGATAAASGASCVWKPADGSNTALTKTGTPPTKNLPESGTRDMTMATSQGTITIKLDVTNAPCSAASFAYLASQKFFDNSSCHRLVTSGIYVLQCGDPSGTGSGGPSYTYGHENLPSGPAGYATGVVAMANANDPDGNGSQFFIIYKDTPTDPSTGQSVLASNFTVIGTVSAGMDVVQKVAAAGADNTFGAGDGKPKLPLNITSVTVGPVAGG
jgi:peptidyl-prolyl cis-trans isomerase B (cyclophilin B)